MLNITPGQTRRIRQLEAMGAHIVFPKGVTSLDRMRWGEAKTLIGIMEGELIARDRRIKADEYADV